MDLNVKGEELDELERVILDPSAEPINLSLSCLKLITDDFSDERLIGRGGYGDVYKGVIPNGLSVAVKRLLQSIETSDRQFEDEVLSMMKAKHKNIVRLLGYCSDTRMVHVKHNGKIVQAQSRERLICLEYMSNGSLDKYISGISHGLEWNYRYRIIRGMCDGLQYLHQANMLHSDLKPSNVLLDASLMPKLADFGMSSQVGKEAIFYFRTQKFNGRGTIGYIAPETINLGELSLSTDIFSLGVVITELLTGSSETLHGDDIEQVCTRWKERLSHSTVEQYLLENICLQVRRCVEVGVKCGRPNPDERPTISEIVLLLHEIDSMSYSGNVGHAPPVPQPAEEHASADTGQSRPDLLYSLGFLKQITDGFSQERVLEKRGTSGLVYMGKIEGGTDIAVKRLLAINIPEKEFTREAIKLTSLEHKNIVKLLGYCYDVAKGGKLVQYNGKRQLWHGAELLLCYQYMPNRSIHDLLFGQGCRELDWHRRYDMITGTCHGLLYLHDGCENRPIAHLNLSLSNVLLDENEVARITDSGLTWLIGENDSKTIANRMHKPRRYMAPEYFLRRGGNMECPTKADIYSLGIMILEIVSGQENHEEKLTKKEFWEKDSQMPSSYSSLKQADMRQVNLCIDIGLRCVAYKPENRPTAGDIIQWLNQGHISVPTPARSERPPIPVPTPNITHAAVHTIRGNEESSNRTAAGRTNKGKRGVIGRLFGSKGGD